MPAHRVPVKNAHGRIIAYLKKLTISPASGKVVSATLILRPTGRQMSLPWDRVVLAGGYLAVDLKESADATPCVEKTNV